MFCRDQEIRPWDGRSLLAEDTPLQLRRVQALFFVLRNQFLMQVVPCLLFHEVWYRVCHEILNRTSYVARGRAVILVV